MIRAARLIRPAALRFPTTAFPTIGSAQVSAKMLPFLPAPELPGIVNNSIAPLGSPRADERTAGFKIDHQIHHEPPHQRNVQRYISPIGEEPRKQPSDPGWRRKRYRTAELQPTEGPNQRRPFELRFQPLADNLESHRAWDIPVSGIPTSRSASTRAGHSRTAASSVFAACSSIFSRR